MNRSWCGCALLAVSAALGSGCTADTYDAGTAGIFPLLAGSLVIDGRAIYLLGEMNQFRPSPQYALTQDRHDGRRHCASSLLRADRAPYRFKFADDAWSAGTNFGFAEPPGTLYVDSGRVRLNPGSRFEELQFYPREDGTYRFCMVERNGGYYAEVELSDASSLAYLEHLLAPGRK